MYVYIYIYIHTYNDEYEFTWNDALIYINVYVCVLWFITALSNSQRKMHVIKKLIR